MMDIITYFNDGISDSGILMILVIVDTVLALSYQLKVKQPIISSRLLSGLLRNVILAVTPSLVTALSIWRPRSDDIYQMLAAILSVFIGYAIIQSILSYVTLWGVKYPEWLTKWLSGEIESKVNKNGNNLSENTNDKSKSNN